MKKSDNFVIAKSIIGFLVVALAAALFLLFQNHKQELTSDGTVQNFMTLTIVGFALLIGLFYLASNSKVPAHHRHHTTTKHTKHHSKKRRRSR